MIRRRATLRSVRKPVLALVAAAGLVVWSGAGTAGPPTVGPIVPGQPSIHGAGQLHGPALKTTGTALHGGVLESGEPTPPRAGGGGSGAAVDGRRSVVAGNTAAAPITAADPATSHTLALSRAGRDSDPATAPPSVPS